MGGIESALVVDDSPSFCSYFQKLLKNCGVQTVDAAYSANQALDVIAHKETNFEIIFFDLNMPGMDGLEFVQTLEKQHYKGHLVLVSGLQKDIVKLAREVMLNRKVSLLGSLEKPVTPECLALIMQKAHGVTRRVSLPEDLIKKRVLKQAIKNGDVMVYFQPFVAYAKKQIVGFECLARLDVKGEGVVSPNRFLPVAERFDLLDDLTESMFRSALVHLPELRNLTANNQLYLSFNLCPCQFENEDLPARINDLISRLGVPKSSVVLEITEIQSLNTPVQLETFNRLRINDFDVSFDDFGSGYTNLSQLADLPCTEIKIDRRFCHGISQEKISEIVVESLLKIAQQKKLRVVAEGVEEGEDLIRLLELGVDQFQGYLFSRPKPFESIVPWIHAWQKAAAKTA